MRVHQVQGRNSRGGGMCPLKILEGTQYTVPPPKLLILWLTLRIYGVTARKIESLPLKNDTDA